MLLAALLPLEAMAQSVGFEATLGGVGRTTAFATQHHEGFTYVAGVTTAADFPSTDGSTHRGDTGEVGDMFLAKFNASGQLVAATLLGGSGSDFANGMAITLGQEGGSPATITLSGWTGSADFRTLDPIQPTLGGKTDAVIAQYDLNLNLLFSTFLGGAEDDQFSGVVAMYDRDLMFFGFTTSTDFPFPSPNAAPAENTVKNLSNNADGLLVKMLPDRSIPMASLFRRTSSGNGTQNEVILAGAFRVIPDGPFEQQALLYVTGWTDGDFFRHSSDPTGSGKRIFMSRIDTENGARGYSRVLGGSGDDIGQGIAITPEGVVVVGQTTSTDLPNSQPLFQPGPGGGTDAVLVAWTHQLLFVTRPPFTAYLGGAGDDSARAVGEAKVLAGAPSPGLQFAGVTASADLPLPATPRTPPSQASFGGGTDGFFGSLGMAVNPESSGPGVLLQARGLTYHGGPGEEAFTALAVVSEGADNFEVAVMGARRPPRVAGALLATANGARLDDPIAQERALFVNFIYGRAALDADLAVSFKPRGPLAPGVVEKVTLVVTNTAQAPSALLNLFLEDLTPLGGGPTTELTRIERSGTVLVEVSNPLPFQFPEGTIVASLTPGQSIEFDLFIRSLPGALQANPPGAGLLARIIATPDLHPSNDTATMVFPLVSSTPQIHVRLVDAMQDPPGVTNPRASYRLRVENNGSVAAENVEVVFTGSNLRDATCRIDGGSALPLPGLGVPGGSRIPVGALQPGQGRDLLVEGEPASPANGTGLSATGTDPADTNPENNAAGGETTPGPGPDYAVEITSRATELATVEGSPAIRLRTVARLTLTLPAGVTPDRVAAASLVIGHTRFSTEVTANPGNMGQCETLGTFSTGCSFPAAAFFQAGHPPGLIEISITEVFDLASQPPVAELSLSVSGDGQDPQRPNNFATVSTLFLPRIQVTLLGAEQDPPALPNPRARHRFRVENVGNATARAVEVAFASATLRNATCRIDDGPPFALTRLDLPSGDLVAIGALAPGQGRNLLVEGEPVDLSSGTKLSATGSDPDDENPENNRAEGETTPAPNPDYAVEIITQTPFLLMQDGAPTIRLLTRARITLTLAAGVSVDRVPPASVLVRHAGSSPGVSATPGNLGSCERLDAATTGCTFPAAAFFQPGSTPGEIELVIGEYLDFGNPPPLPTVSISLSGDGQDPMAPNNFASATQEMAKKGALSIARIFTGARTIRLPDGAIVRMVTQHVRIRNEGPGVVDNVRLTIHDRHRFGGPGPQPLLQLPKVIAGSAAGVVITGDSAAERVEIASLAAGAEIVLEFVDLSETMLEGRMVLEAPPGADLNVINRPLIRIVEARALAGPGILRDMALSLVSQRLEAEARAGGRVMVRVTEFAVANRGETPAEEVELQLRGSGVHLGGSLNRRFGSGSTSSLSPVSGVSRPEAPANPNVIQVALGRFEPGETRVYVLRDDVAEPTQNALLGLSADVTSDGWDVNVANNHLASDTEYRAYLATLDYSVVLRQTSLERFPDPNLSTPAPVPAIRSRFECDAFEAPDNIPLPRFLLEIQQPGTILDVRLVPKNPATPIPTTGFVVTRDHPLSFNVRCDSSIFIALNFYIEVVAAVVPPGQSALLVIKADLEGDGEIPSDGNNNRARGSFEYQAADLAVTRLPGDVELPSLFDGGAVMDRWLVENKSPTAIARGVRLTRIETTAPPPPQGVARPVEVLSVTGDLPLDTELCLQGAAGGSCLVGDIEPGGRREVLVLSRLATLPGGVTWLPTQVTLGLHVVADNEAQLGDNTATHERLARLALFGVARVENGEFVIQLHFPSGGATPVIEQAPSVNGPWTPVQPPQNGSELRLPITGQQGYLRGRMGPETP